MEIGTKLKNARTKCGLTQEQVAEEIGVSRQTMSNWENSRSYPDIVSVIKLSDLYSVSLDELLKEDRKMIDHLDEATNTVKSNRRLIWIIMMGAYIIIWTVVVLSYHILLGSKSLSYYERGVYSTAYTASALYVILPLIAAEMSAVLGWMTTGWVKWILPLAFGVMEGLAVLIIKGPGYSIDMDPGQFRGNVAGHMLSAFLFMLIVCAAGMGIVTLIRYLKNRKKRKGSGISEDDKTPGREEAQL